MVLMLADALRAKEKGRQEAADAYWTNAVEYLVVNENRIQSVFDPWQFFGTWQWAFAEVPKVKKQML